MTQSNVALLLLSSLFAAPMVLYGPRAEAAPSKDQTVTAYFAALDREDYTGALGRTTGQAYQLTSSIVGELQRRSAERHCRVDIATRHVDIAAAGPSSVLVRFDIDVLGRFMFFRKKVRSLHGEATFSIDENGQISNIDGDLGL